MPNIRVPERDQALAQGLKWYFTGKPCKNGHVAERSVSCHKCRECDLQRQAARRQNDPEFRARANERHRQWRGENRERALENSRLWYENNKERSTEAVTQWRKNNRAAVNAITRRYYKNSPKLLAIAKARQKRVRHATPLWADMQAIREFYENCPQGYHVDHIIPLNGKTVCGLHVLANLQYLTASENSSKGNRWLGLEIRHASPTIFNPQNHLYSDMATKR